jgi:hypothetical protein
MFEFFNFVAGKVSPLPCMNGFWAKDELLIVYLYMDDTPFRSLFFSSPILKLTVDIFELSSWASFCDIVDAL